MESNLSFRIIGNYSIQQADWRFSELKPRENCCICHNAKYGTVLISESYQGVYICAECLMKKYLGEEEL